MVDKIIRGVLAVIVLGLMFWFAPYVAGDENPSKVGYRKLTHLYNMWDQDRWITVYDQVVDAGDVDTCVVDGSQAIDISETYGSPQFFAYSCDIDTGTDDPNIWIDYRTRIDQDDANWFDTKFNEYYIVHEDSGITIDSLFCGPLTVYGANALLFIIHNDCTAAGDYATVVLKIWMKH